MIIDRPATITQALQTEESSSQQSLLSTKLFIQMSGAPGSGKSTTANLLGSTINASDVPHDLIKSTILDHDIEFSQASKLTYSLDWMLAEDAMTQGRSVIIDNVCNYRETIDRGRSLAQKHGFSYWYIEVCIDINRVAVLEDRLKHRVSSKAQRTGVDQHLSGMNSGPESVQEEARTRFQKWVLQPCRPEKNIVYVDAAPGGERSR